MANHPTLDSKQASCENNRIKCQIPELLKYFSLFKYNLEVNLLHPQISLKRGKCFTVSNSLAYNSKFSSEEAIRFLLMK